MKTNHSSNRRNPRAARQLLRRLIVGASLLAGGAGMPAQGADAPQPLTPEQNFEGGTNSWNNWIELSAGGLMTTGDRALAQQQAGQRRSVFGGIEDLHLQQDIAKDASFSLDGRSIIDEHNYKLGLALKREDLGFIRFNFENFQSWSDAAGGYYPPTRAQYKLSEDALSLDRGEISFEGGLTLKGIPKVTFKYAHRYRDGDKSSTIWGQTHPDLSNAPGLANGLLPSVENVDEKADIFQLDAAHRIKATDVGIGVRYETGTLRQELKTAAWQGEPAFQRATTDRQGTSYDLLSAHAFTETWLKKNLFFSTGALFANLDNSFTGSHIHGADFDVNYTPGYPLGYYDLSGGSHKQEYVVNLNLMAMPASQFAIVPSIRIEKENWDANSVGVETENNATGLFHSNTDGDSLDVRERLEAKFTGFTNWVLYAGGEWNEGSGNLKENGGIGQTNGIIGVPPIRRETDDTRLFQKYFLGARWYPLRRVTVDAGYYYKNSRYDYDHTLDSTPNDPALGDAYPAFLIMQDFETHDGNIGLTLRPSSKITLASRYECQLSSIHTRPDQLREVESSAMTSHIFSQNASWTPWSRLCLQAGINYVASETKTPASAITQAALNSQNNYWTLNFNSTVVLDDRTDFSLGYFHYQSDNYKNISPAGLPFGVSAREQGVTAAISRRLTQNLRLNLKYAFSHFHDVVSGGNNDYDAHLVFSSLQYRF